MAATFNDDISIRQITSEDINYIVEIETHHKIDMCHPIDLLNQLFVREYKKRWEQKLYADMYTLILFVKEKRMGFISYSAACLNEKQDITVAEINQMYIKPEIRGRHLGKLLCQTAIEEMRKKCFQRVTVWLTESRKKTRHFYETMGFKITAITRTEVIKGDVVLQENQYELIL